MAQVLEQHSPAVVEEDGARPTKIRRTDSVKHAAPRVSVPSRWVTLLIKRATGLQNVERGWGISDPYALLKVGENEVFQTSVENDTLSPEWNQAAKVEWDGKSCMTLELWDKNVLTKDRLMGKATLTEDLIAESFKGSLDVDPMGTLEVAVGAPRTNVTIKSATGLQNVERGWGVSDPYVILKLGKTSKLRTDVKDDTVCPEWNHTEEIEWDGTSSMAFEIWDKNFVTPDKSMGKATLTSEQIAAGFAGALDVDRMGTIDVDIRML